MLHLILLTKTYNIDDYNAWLKYHSKLNCKIHVINNDSICSLDSSILATYEEIHGWPDQYTLYDKIFKENRYNFANDDYVLTIDDDEYLWYDSTRFTSIENAIQYYMSNTSFSLLLPQILMSTHHIRKHRDKILPLYALYRRNDLSSQGKAIVQYDFESKYQYKHNKIEQGHVPFINNLRWSTVVCDKAGVHLSNTTYGETDYQCGLRLYHYHIKSLDDWKIKYERGSAAVKTQWYDKDITKNLAYDHYEIQDLTMYNEFIHL